MRIEYSAIDKLSRNRIFRSCAPYKSLREGALGFVDVGASGGICEVVRPIASLVSVLAFEPDPIAYQSLLNETAGGSPWARCQVEPIALHSAGKNVDLNLITWSQNNSLLIPNKKFVKRYGMVKWIRTGKVRVRATSLDSLLFGPLGEQKHQGEFLKLDTQGTEYEILKGARRTIEQRTVAVLTEVEFAELYEGQKLFSDIERLLRNLGFSFYGFTTMHLRSLRKLDKRKEIGRERIFQADAVFFRDPLQGGYNVRRLSERGNHVLFVCALLLGYFDFALELALGTWAKGVEADRVKRLVHYCAALPVDATRREILSLVRRLDEKPELANVEVGRFVDSRRYFYDYSDVATPQVG